MEEGREAGGKGGKRMLYIHIYTEITKWMWECPEKRRMSERKWRFTDFGFSGI